MEPLFDDPGCVRLEWNVEQRIFRGRRDAPARIGHQVERELGWCISDHVTGEDRVVQARLDSNEVQQRTAKLHSSTNGDVIRMRRVGAPVSVEQLIFGDVVTIIVRSVKRRLDRQRCTRLPENGRTEDAFLLAPDRHPLAMEGQALVQCTGRYEAAGSFS